MYLERTCRGVVSPEMLPPTESAACFHGPRTSTFIKCRSSCHGLKTRYQIIEWSLSKFIQNDPSEWGWMKEDNIYKPVYTHKVIAPPNVQKIIRLITSYFTVYLKCTLH